MLKEIYYYITIRPSRYIRKIGYLHESIATWQRYKRCKKHWEPHLKNCREYILSRASRCKNTEKVIIFGAGQLADIPLKELTQIFEEIVLVDVVFAPETRKEAYKHGAKCVEYDVTSISEYIAKNGSLPKYAPLPDLFVDDQKVSLVISVNILSQLPIIPTSFLRRNGCEDNEILQNFAHQIIVNHMEYLSNFNSDIILISDESYSLYDKNNQLAERKSLLYGVQLPDFEKQNWDWEIAPLGEIQKDLRRINHVFAMSWQNQIPLP